jgi:hypothetical protein
MAGLLSGRILCMVRTMTLVLPRRALSFSGIRTAGCLTLAISKRVLRALRPRTSPAPRPPVFRTFSPVRTLALIKTLTAFRPLCTFSTLRPLRTLSALRPLCTLSTLRLLRTFSALRPLCTLSALRPLYAICVLCPFTPLRTVTPGTPFTTESGIRTLIFLTPLETGAFLLTS